MRTASIRARATRPKMKTAMTKGVVLYQVVYGVFTSSDRSSRTRLVDTYCRSAGKRKAIKTPVLFDKFSNKQIVPYQRGQ